MEQVSSSFIVYFEEPFWVGVYTRICGMQLQAAKITFGAQPTEPQIYAYLLQNWGRLHFSPIIQNSTPVCVHSNPKRRQREARRQTSANGIGTKSQQALKKAQIDGKQARQKRSRMEKEALAARQFALRTEKRKQKHKGH